jgi:beta-glucosidase
VTIYPGSYSSKLKIQDMAFTTSPGRGYRYYSGTPLFEFGSGLSLTTFTHSCACDKLGPTDVYISCKCNVKNTGPMVGDEVVMVFDALSAPIRASIGSSHPVPIKRLVGFERTRLPPGGSATVDFNISKVSLSLVTADGSKKLYPGVAYAIVWLLSVAIFGLRSIR